MTTSSTADLVLRDGDLLLTLGGNCGGITRLEWAGRTLIEAQDMPMLQAQVLHSRTWDGLVDHVQDATFESAQVKLLEIAKTSAHAVAVVYELAFAGVATLEASLHLAVGDAPGAVQCEMTLRAVGDWTHRWLRSFEWRLPLALHRRKRIAQGGDADRIWDARYVYDFHARPNGPLLECPDHNQWRHLAVEQDSAQHFRIWRAESDRVAPLIAQHGERAPGWISTYDAQGGVLLGYRSLHARAPKTLAIDAMAGGAARLLIHPDTVAAVHPNAASVTGQPHRFDIVAFSGEFPDAQPNRVWSKLSEMPAQTLRSTLEDAELPCMAGAATPELWSPLVEGGVPFAQGALRDPARVRLIRDGHAQPLQTRVTGWWPDGSVKWLLLTFPLVPGAAGEPAETQAEWMPVEITLRDGSRLPVALQYGSVVQPVVPDRSIAASQDGDIVTIDTGPLRFTATVGMHWLQHLAHQGQSILADDRPDAPLAHADFLLVDDYQVNSTHAAGHRDAGPVVIESVVLEQSGPLRAVVKLTGRAMATEQAVVVLRLTADVGRSWLHVSHSIEFMQRDPRRTFLRSLAVTLPLRMTRKPTNIRISGEAHALDAEASSAVWRQRSHLHGDVLIAREGNFAFEQSHRRTHAWIDLCGEDAGAAVILRDAWQSYPNALRADVNPAQLTAELWPASSPLMDVRRYSEAAHIAQGEATRSGMDPHYTGHDWVDKRYYAQDPFVGVSRTHEMMFVFHDGTPTGDTLDAVAADLQSPPLLYAGEAWYRHVGVLSGPTPKSGTQLYANFDAVIDFWLFHQRRWGWYGLWDYGDFRHMPGCGDGWIVPPNDLARLVAMDAAERPVAGIPMQLDYWPEQDWAFDSGRQGWSNTEGLPGMFLQSQYLRTGRRDLFFAAEAMARHVRDVDMRHAGRWFGSGTRHGVQHWSDGNHEERQTCPSEWRLIHHLRGDARGRDFCEQLLCEVYRRTPATRHADHSGRLMGLLVSWELTGSAVVGELLARYVRLFIVPEGLAIAPAVRFEAGPVCDHVEEINDGNMFFHGFGGMHALVEYAQLTHDAPLHTALIKMADAMLRDPGTRAEIERGSYDVWKTFQPVTAFAARHANDAAPYREALKQWRAAGGWRLMYHGMLRDRRWWSDRHRANRFRLPAYMLLVNWLGDVGSALEGTSELSPEALVELRRCELEGLANPPRRTIWQHEYDDPRLAGYLSQHPHADI